MWRSLTVALPFWSEHPPSSSLLLLADRAVFFLLLPLHLVPKLYHYPFLVQVSVVDTVVLGEIDAVVVDLIVDIALYITTVVMVIVENIAVVEKTENKLEEKN